MLSPNAVAFLGSLFPKSKSDAVCDEELVELLLAPPAAGGGEEGDAKTDVADETGAADHDVPPEMISRTV